MGSISSTLHRLRRPLPPPAPALATSCFCSLNRTLFLAAVAGDVDFPWAGVSALVRCGGIKNKRDRPCQEAVLGIILVSGGFHPCCTKEFVLLAQYLQQCYSSTIRSMLKRLDDGSDVSAVVL